MGDEEEDVISGGVFGTDDDDALLGDDLDLDDPAKLPVDEEEGYDPEDKLP
ncbi:MAG: hypothetical protein QG583_296 [Patescibacteria group bacterium]|nr:hypothetical protein [Patescibacteria group bacterium]